MKKTRSVFKIIVLVLLGAPLRAEMTEPDMTNSDFNVAINPTLSFGSSRKVALGGAYVAIAEGVASFVDNPAGVVYRHPSSTGTWSADGTLGVYSIQGNDIDNNGNTSQSYKDYSVYTIGGLLQYKRWGLGLYTMGQRFTVGDQDTSQTYDFAYGFINAGYTTKNREWAWGIGVRPAMMKSQTQGDQLLKISGVSPNAGFLWNPQRGSFRLGGSWQGPLKNSNVLPQNTIIPRSGGQTYYPQKILLPTIVKIGASWQFNKGVFARGHPLLITAQTNVMGRTPNAVGIESFLEQKLQYTGEHTTVGVAGGGEYEILTHRLKVRAGSYWEPSRYSNVQGRLHGTAGFEVYLFTVHALGDWPMSFSYSMDHASRYLTQFFGLGLYTF